jgi:hypothetical protein
MGPKGSTAAVGPQEMEYYVIRLEADQSVLLYGYVMAKTTLTWRDVLMHPGIHLQSCCECGVDPHKLCRMQPDVREWMRTGKAKLQDCALMEAWKPHVFRDLGCNIGDLVVYRKWLNAPMLIRAHITFETLQDMYGLNAEIMALLRYTPQEWLQLQIPTKFLQELTDEQWNRIFGSTQNRCELMEQSKRNHNNVMENNAS